MVHFNQVCENYLIARYGGKDRILKSIVAVQLQPFVNLGWWATMLEKNVKDKNFEEVKAIILEVASIHRTHHDRRLNILHTKTENVSHSDFLWMLEEKIDLTDYQNWSQDSMVRTLFLTFCDVEMGKVVTWLLSKQTLDMAWQK